MRCYPFIYIILLFFFSITFSSFAQLRKLQETNLKYARLAINENKPKEALKYLEVLLNKNLTREGEMEVIALLGKTYSILSLNESCSDNNNHELCEQYVSSTFYWYEQILKTTDKEEIFHQYTSAELDRFYENLLTRGVNEFLDENFTSSSFFFTQAFSINNDDIVSCRYGMISNEFDGNYIKALTYSDRLLELKYDSTEVYESRAFYYEQLQQPDLALKEVENGLNKYPSQFSLIYRGVGICVREKWYERALRILEPYLDKNPFDNKTLIATGMVYEQLGNDSKAIYCYTRAIIANEYSFDAYFNLGQIQFRKAIQQQKLLVNWTQLKKKEKYKDVHKSDIKKTVKFYLEQCELNLRKAETLDAENLEVINTLRSTLVLLNKSKELKRIDDTLESM